MSDRKDIPSPSAPNWPQRITEEMRVMMGKAGSQKNRAITIGDLPNLGGLAPGGIGGLPGGDVYEPDLTPPPTPSGFALSAAISHVFVEHDAPLYLQGHGHARTILYGAKAITGQPLPTFSNAVALAEFTGMVFAYPSDPATTWRMWIFWETTDGVRSIVPAGGTNGVEVKTGQDVGLLLEALTGKITQSELYSALGARIDLIDGSGTGSVNARILAEETDRNTAIDAEASARQTLIANITSGSSDNLVTNPTYDPAGYRDAATGITTLEYVDRGAPGMLAGAPAARILKYSKSGSTAAWVGREVRFTNNTTRMPVAPNDVVDASVVMWYGMALPLVGIAYLWLIPVDAAGNAMAQQLVLRYDNAAPNTWQKLQGSLTMPAGAVHLAVNYAIESTVSTGVQVSMCEVDIRKRGASAMVLAAAVQTEASVRASVDGYQGAQQNVRIDVAGHVAGYGIAGSAANGSGASATSAFGVRATSFFVAPPALAQATAPTANLYDGFVWLDTSVTPNVTRYRSGAAWTTTAPVLPFIIQTTPTTINGVSAPAGVYANDLFVKNGTITNAKIGNLAVDDAKIANLSVSKILAGSMVVGQYINSANYISGVQGWSINSAGTAEFSNAVVRGTVYANAGAIGGILMHGTALYSANYVWQSSGFALESNGNAYFNNLWSRGSIMGGSFLGYAWPAAGLTGYYIGPEGLLVGNANNGRYFQIDSQGNVYAPNFSIVAGNAYFNGSGTFNGNGTFSGNLSAAGGTFSGLLTAAAVGAVNTINISGQTVTTLGIYPAGATNYEANAWRPMVYMYPDMPTGGTGVLAVVSVIGAAPSTPDIPVQIRLRNLTKNTTVRTWDAVNVPSTGGAMLGYISDITVADPEPAVGVNTYVLESYRGATYWSATTIVSLLVARR